MQQVGAGTLIAIAEVIGPALLAFAGAFLAVIVNRRGASELDRRWKREETLRTLRWAADNAASSEVGRASIGVSALVALNDAELVQDEDRAYVRTIVETAVGEFTRRRVGNALRGCRMTETSKVELDFEPTRAQVIGARALVRWAANGEGEVDDFIRAIAAYELDNGLIIEDPPLDSEGNPTGPRKVRLRHEPTDAAIIAARALVRWAANGEGEVDDFIRAVADSPRAIDKYRPWKAPEQKQS